MNQIFCLTLFLNNEKISQFLYLATYITVPRYRVGTVPTLKIIVCLCRVWAVPQKPCSFTSRGSWLISSLKEFLLQVLFRQSKNTYLNLKGLSSEMEGGIKLASIDRSPFKQLTAQHNTFFYFLKSQCTIYI